MAVLTRAQRKRPRAQIQRKCACGGKCADCKSGGDEEQSAVSRLLQLQRSAGNEAIAAALAGVVQRQEDEDTAAGEDDSVLPGLGDAAGALAGLPSIPGLPDVPGLPELPKLPKLPIPEIPGLGGGDGPSLPELPSLPEIGKPPNLKDLAKCTPAPTLAAAQALHNAVLAGIVPLAASMGSNTLSIWLSYLNQFDLSMPRKKAGPFVGSGEIPDGFRDHHITFETEQALVEEAAKELAGPKFSLLPAPGATVLMPVSSVLDAATLKRVNTPGDPMALDYDLPSKTIPGLLAGGIGSGGELGGGGGVDPDTRAVSGFLEVSRDAAGTSLTIKPQLTYNIHDTVDFCPGNLGEGLALGLTLPMSVLEATENRFGFVFAADVPFDVEHPGPSRLSGPFSIPSTPPTPPPVPPGVFPKTGPAKTTGTLLRVRTGPSLSAPTLRLIELKDTDIEVINQVHGDPVDGNDVWDQISDGFVSDRFVEFQEVFVP